MHDEPRRAFFILEVHWPPWARLTRPAPWNQQPALAQYTYPEAGVERSEPCKKISFDPQPPQSLGPCSACAFSASLEPERTEHFGARSHRPRTVFHYSKEQEIPPWQDAPSHCQVGVDRGRRVAWDKGTCMANANCVAASASAFSTLKSSTLWGSVPLCVKWEQCTYLTRDKRLKLPAWYLVTINGNPQQPGQESPEGTSLVNVTTVATPALTQRAVEFLHHFPENTCAGTGAQAIKSTWSLFLSAWAWISGL